MMATLLRIVLLVAVLSAMLAGGAACAAVFTVAGDGSGDYSSIQAAISAVGNGDEIVVQPGRYHETVNFLGKALTVRSSAGPANTWIFLEEQTRIINLNGDSTLEGFTITGGRARVGGGIWVTDGASPTIRGNIIEGNTAEWNGVLPAFGGGIAVDPLCEPVITRNVIRNNLALGDTQGFYAYGAGIDLADDSTAIIENNIIENNSTTDSGGGVSLGVAGVTTPVSIVHNTIIGNLAGQGGATSSIFGGGILLEVDSSATIRNNLIVDNDATAAGQGGGIHFFSNGLQGMTYENNDFDANIPDDCAGLPGSKCSTGQFFLAPLFLNPSGGNYRPRSDSPILELGTVTGAPALDADGQARSADGDLDGIAAPDPGAFENQRETTRLSFQDSISLTWDGSINPAVRFELYRDDLAALGSTLLGACLEPDLAATGATDGTVPAVGGGSLYLVRGVDTASGRLGFGSDKTERLAATECP